MSKAKVVTRPNMVTKPVGNKHHSHRHMHACMVCHWEPSSLSNVIII